MYDDYDDCLLEWVFNGTPSHYLVKVKVETFRVLICGEFKVGCIELGRTGCICGRLPIDIREKGIAFYLIKERLTLFRINFEELF